jgi:hypothetical protein
VGGQASISTTTLPLGSDSLSAVYSGDGNYQPNTGKFTQTVQMAGTSTALASSMNPSNSGQVITFTATVTSNTTAIPAGTVTFLDGTATIGSSVLNGSGVATFSTSTLVVGTHNITASYAGNGNFTGSTSTVLSEVVQKASTSIAVSSSQNPLTINQSVTLTAKLSWSNSLTPTGTVTFLDGATTIGSSAVNGSGVATFSTSTLSVGTHNITASYVGDGNFTASTSTLLSQVVQQGDTSVALVSSVNPSTESQSVQFTATVNSVSGVIPTGTVKFMDGTSQVGSSALNGSGIATLSIMTLSVGTHGITAVYSGDSNSDPSTSPVLSEVVQKANTTTALISSLNPSTFEQSLTITATVSSSTPGTPTGTVTFLSGTTTLGSSALNAGGVATLSMATLTVGTDGITATYSGDANFSASTSPVLNQVVQKANTTTVLSSAPISANLNQSVTFTATVTPGTAGSPTGTVSFMDGTAQLGTSTLNASGVATFSTSALTAGTHNISAAYSGDGNFNVSTSTVVSVVVDAPNFSLSATTPSPSSVAPGASAKSTITVNLTGGLNPSALTLACSVTPAVSQPVTCSLGPISMGTNNTGTSILTVATAGPQVALAPPAGGEHRPGIEFAFGLMIPAILLSGARLKKPSQKKLLSFCIIFMVLGGCLLEVACGAGGSAPKNIGNSGTPAGTYTVTVTGSTSGTPPQTTLVVLTVQ